MSRQNTATRAVRCSGAMRGRSSTSPASTAVPAITTNAVRTPADPGPARAMRRAAALRQPPTARRDRSCRRPARQSAPRAASRERVDLHRRQCRDAERDHQQQPVVGGHAHDGNQPQHRLRPGRHVDHEQRAGEQELVEPGPLPRAAGSTASAAPLRRRCNPPRPARAPGTPRCRPAACQRCPATRKASSAEAPSDGSSDVAVCRLASCALCQQVLDERQQLDGRHGEAHHSGGGEKPQAPRESISPARVPQEAERGGGHHVQRGFGVSSQVLRGPGEREMRNPAGPLPAAISRAPCISSGRKIAALVCA